jgi:hypothetical protein
VHVQFFEDDLPPMDVGDVVFDEEFEGDPLNADDDEDDKASIGFEFDFGICCCCCC